LNCYGFGQERVSPANFDEPTAIATSVTPRHIHKLSWRRFPLLSWEKIQVALEKAGVEFIPEDDLKGPGFRLKESTRSKPPRTRKSLG
jgi:hypothetical protein